MVKRLRQHILDEFHATWVEQETPIRCQLAAALIFGLPIDLNYGKLVVVDDLGNRDLLPLPPEACWPKIIPFAKAKMTEKGWRVETEKLPRSTLAKCACVHDKLGVRIESPAMPMPMATLFVLHLAKLVEEHTHDDAFFEVAGTAVGHG